MRRGRPPYPDVLTPREWEVLALIREGLTNEQIARRLGISERGARYHVSEILSKLGVDRREAAALWQREPQRGLVAPPVFQFLKGIGTLSASKMVYAGGAFVVFVGLLAALNYLRPSPVAQPAASQPQTQAVEIQFPQPCASRGGIREVTTIEQAASLSTFSPKLPSFIPSGFEARCIEWYSLFSSPPADTINAVYRRGGGDSLTISQGYLLRHASLYAGAPSHAKGTTRVGQREVYWVSGEFARLECCDEKGIAVPAGWREGDMHLFWVEETEGDYPVTFLAASELSFVEPLPSGARTPLMVMQPASSAQAIHREGRRGRTDVWYGLSSNALSLEELVEIAASVPLH